MNLTGVKRIALGILLAGSASLAATGQTGGLRGALGASASTGDSLYVGDEGAQGVGSAVLQFTASTGQYVRTFVQSQSGSCTLPRSAGSLCGPRGMFFEGNLLVANQNENVVDNQGNQVNGELDLYSRVDGKFLGAIVPYTSPNAPFHPDGIIRGPDNRTLYVADLGETCDTCGRVATYDINTGRFLGNLEFTNFITSGANPTPGEFHPRGVVFGPDGLLYISLRSLTNPLLGGIVTYNAGTGGVHLLASYTPSASGCSVELHRPDGLVFGPDGNLYVTSFRANSSDVDRILIFNGRTGACLNEIDLDQVGADRAYAQYLLFGPGGHLFVPIACCASNAGAVRQYILSTNPFAYTSSDFVPPSAQNGPVGSAWSLTFGQTNPTTLAYGQQ